MVSYVELCQAIEQWQRTQGRVSPVQSRLQQAMWRAFIEEHAPQVQMDFAPDQAASAPDEWDDQLGDDDPSGHAFAATGS